MVGGPAYFVIERLVNESVEFGDARGNDRPTAGGEIMTDWRSPDRFSGVSSR
jgi:hypothetical protein